MTFWPFATDKQKHLLIGCLFVITLFIRLVLIGFYNHDYGGIDMNVIYGIQRLLTGQALYQDPQLPPYAVIQYTPLYYHLAAAIARLFRVSAYDVQAVYVTARILALSCNLLTVLIVYFIFRQCGFNKPQSFIFAMPVLMILTPHYYVRGDSLHLLFFALFVFSFVLFLRYGSKQYLLLAALFSACCVCTKQSGVLCAGIAGFYMLFLVRQHKNLLLYLLVFTGCTALLLWCCNDSGWYELYGNLVLGLKNGYSAGFLFAMFTSQFYFDLIPCYVVGAIIVYTAICYNKEPPYRFIAAAVAISFVFALLTGFKIGSSNNYFTEFLFFILLLIPGLLQADYSNRLLLRVRGRNISVRVFVQAAFMILVLSKTIGFFTSVYLEKRLDSVPLQYAREQRLYRYFKKVLQLREGQFIYFTENSFLNNIFIGYSMMPTWDVVSQIWLADPGTYDYSGFIRSVNNGLVQYIVVRQDNDDINKNQSRLPFMHFDPARFQRIASVEGFYIYRYNGL